MTLKSAQLIYMKEMFAKRFTDLRHEKDITQDEIAHKLDVSRQAVGHWETGVRTPSLDAIAAVADLFDCSISYLLGFSVNRKNDEREDINNLFHHATTPMMLTTWDGERMNLIDANHSLLDILGYTKDELKQDLNVIVAPQYKERLPQIRRNLVRQDNSSFGFVHLSKTKQLLPVELNIHQLKSQVFPNPTFLVFCHYGDRED